MGPGQSVPKRRCPAPGLAGSGGRGGRSLAPLPGSGRGSAMEAGERRGRLRREAAEYYQGHRVPERMEEALNTLFPLRPGDLYGELVARGGEAAGRGRTGLSRPRVPARGGAEGPCGCPPCPCPLPALALRPGAAASSSASQW